MRGNGERTGRAGRIHELGLKLIGLGTIAGITFALTVVFAGRMREQSLQDAGILYARGTSDLAGGRAATAVTALRRAARKDQGNARYTLQLARAMAAAGQPEAAERALLLLRAGSPEDPEVNLALARLAAGRDDLEMAVRYYRYALYAPWPDLVGPRAIRRELIVFLLDHGDRERALAELIAARANSEESAAARRDLGELLTRAGEPRLALEEFRRALALGPADPDLRLAAGRAAFAVGDYAAASTYLADAPADSDGTRMRDTARAILRGDPLAGRIPAAERVARTERLVGAVTSRAGACGVGDDDPRLQELARLLTQVRRTRGRDADQLEDSLDAAYTLMSSLQNCGTASPLERALLVIGERHRDAS